MKTVLHEKREFTHFRELVEWAGSEYADRCAYSFRRSPHDKDVVRISFHQLRNDVRALSSQLLSMGCAGKHCAVIGKFSYEWALLYFSVLSIGGVLVPLDRDWHAEDLADTLKKADAEFLFCDEDLADKEEIIRKQVSFSAPTVFLNAVERERNVGTMLALGQMKYQKSPKSYENAPIDTEALALLVFTSGTTGQGKGVMLSQNAVLSDLSCIIPYIDFSLKTIGVLPPHHTYGSSVMFAAHTMIGAEVYISSGIRYITKELKEQKPGHLVLVPLYLETFYRRILANVKDQGKEALLQRTIKMSNALRKVGIDRRKQFFASIRNAFGGEIKTIISGGAPINPEILAFFDSIGITTLNGYGITECAPIVAVNRSRQVVEGSVGHVIDIDRVKIHEPNEDGEGEILVKGPNVMLGYYKNEAATAEAFDRRRYFRTGDYGRLDKNNVLYITGRKKNLIILSNGKNVYPEEIENQLIAVPGVLEVVVYEGKSRRGMAYNAIVAEIYPDADYCEKNNITNVKDYLKQQLADYNKQAVPYKKVTHLKVRKEEFPKNTLRKIMRFKLDTTIE
ncbi:MAG: AMP-binding protein [Clostridia bacterium]|nr:AMP-binding protein [Clostridia bacterium]